MKQKIEAYLSEIKITIDQALKLTGKNSFINEQLQVLQALKETLSINVNGVSLKEIAQKASTASRLVQISFMEQMLKDLPHKLKAHKDAAEANQSIFSTLKDFKPSFDMTVAEQGAMLMTSLQNHLTALNQFKVTQSIKPETFKIQLNECEMLLNKLKNELPKTTPKPPLKKKSVVIPQKMLQDDKKQEDSKPIEPLEQEHNSLAAKIKTHKIQLKKLMQKYTELKQKVKEKSRMVGITMVWKRQQMLLELQKRQIKLQKNSLVLQQLKTLQVLKIETMPIIKEFRVKISR